jgi:2-polyprenyl-3-methyl-5-hydroxy-6-metoxy-1,4-benzoquinol methylase
MMLLRPGQPQLRAVSRALRPRPPKHIRARQAKLSESARAEFGSFIRSSGLYGHPSAYWDTPAGLEDLGGESEGLLQDYRETIIPWLDSLRPLAGLSILEIGLGTGSSAVALAEQGALVTGIEMEEAALTVARKRSEICAVDFKWVHANATQAHRLVDVGSYDLVIFFAVLEHMTSEECLESLHAYWAGMKLGAHLALVATPNRLWWYDTHTAKLPFFHWLPPEIAVQYSSFSPHDGVAALSKHPGPEALLRLQRWGRGISFHEIELAIGPVRELPTVSSFEDWRRRRDIAQTAKFLLRDRRYRQFLRHAVPDIPVAWMEPSINLVIRRI